MRLVFAGTPDSAASVLEAIIASSHEVCAVLTQPDRPKGRGRKAAHSAVKEFALNQHIPVLQPDKINTGAFWEIFRGINPDAGVLAYYGGIIGRTLLTVPKFGWLNVHPSLLPAYRGPSPVPSAILNGDTETGVTIIKLDREMDHGPILSRRRSAIGPGESAGELLSRLSQIGAEMIVRALDAVERGAAEYSEQDHEAATYTKILGKNDGVVDWPGVNLHNFARAMTPWPGARTKIKAGLSGKEVFLTICRTEKYEGDFPAASAPGTIFAIGPRGLSVRDADGAALITAVKVAGKKEVPACDFVNGCRVKEGDRFV